MGIILEWLTVGMVNGGGDGFTNFSRSHEKLLLPLCCRWSGFLLL